MSEIPWESVVNGSAGLAALYLAVQMRSAVQAIRHVVRNHETRIEALEASARPRPRKRHP